MNIHEEQSKKNGRMQVAVFGVTPTTYSLLKSPEYFYRELMPYMQSSGDDVATISKKRHECIDEAAAGNDIKKRQNP